MSEAILIRSEIAQKTESRIEKTIGVCLAIAVICGLWLCLPTYDYYTGYVGIGDGDGFAITLLSVGGAALLCGIIISIIFWVHSKCELIVTEDFVKGKTLLGKEVMLPMNQISACSTRKFLSTVAVATSSGYTKFSIIGNYLEIGTVLAKAIVKNKTSSIESTSSKKPINNTEQLKELKELLDSGIITQEEFNAKKKQLLGL